MVQDEDERRQGMLGGLGGLRVRCVVEVVMSGFSGVGSPTFG